MSKLPKLNIEGLSHPEMDNSLISPVTPASVENEPGSGGNGFGNKRRRVGGLPISALVNEKDDDSPVPYPGEPAALGGTEPATQARPEFPSILYQMSEFVTQLGERAVERSLPTFNSLGLPTTEQLAQGVSRKSTDGSQSQTRASATSSSQMELRAHNTLPPLRALSLPTAGQGAPQEVSGKSVDGSHSCTQAPTPNFKQSGALGHNSRSPSKTLGEPTAGEVAARKESHKPTDDGSVCGAQASTPNSTENVAPGQDEVVAQNNGNSLAHAESEDKPKASSRKRTRTERDMPIATAPEIETLISTLREREQGRGQEGNNKRTPPSTNVEEDGEAITPAEPAARNLTAGVSNASRITKPGKQRRGRPNGDNRPRPHACPTCQRRFHQQSGVVNHYRVVHLKEKRFECPHKCGLKFGARGDVTRHVDAVHNKFRNFECQVCGDAFARKSILTRHCKNMHNDVFGADEAHDCVHGCVYRPKDKRGEEDKEGDQK